MSARIPIFNMSLGALLARAALLLIVIVWTVPTFGLLISSLRDKDQLAISGWWTTLQSTQVNEQARLNFDNIIPADAGDGFTLEGSIFEEGENKTVDTFGGGFLRGDITDFEAGQVAELEDGSTLQVNSDGTYVYTTPNALEADVRAPRFFYVANIPPTLTLDNYEEVLQAEGLGQSFINTFTVTIPATIIPIAIAAFASYAFAWMDFPGRQLLFIIVVGLLVVPLQMSLIPLLRLYNDVAPAIGIDAKSYPGIWLAHTGFGLPLAIYLLRNYIGGLPREIIESAKIDGASHFQIFVRLILPLSVPALAAFGIFQFLWVWNDLLVALVFLGKGENQIVMTSRLRELLGSRGDNWEILTSSAFISMAVPLIVFFSLQRYFVRGLLAGSVKGG